MDRYTVEEAQANLEELLDRVEAGDEFIITKDGVDQVKLVLCDASEQQAAVAD